MSTNFIYQKKKALSKFYCDELIEYFEEQIKKGNICSGQVSSFTSHFLFKDFI